MYMYMYNVHVYMYICATVIEFRFLEEKERGQLFNVNNTTFLWLWNFVMYGRIGKHPEQSLLLYSVTIVTNRELAIALTVLTFELP